MGRDHLLSVEGLCRDATDGITLRSNEPSPQRPAPRQSSRPRRSRLRQQSTRASNSVNNRLFRKWSSSSLCPFPPSAAHPSELQETPGILWEASVVDKFASQAPGVSKTMNGVSKNFDHPHELQRSGLNTRDRFSLRLSLVFSKCRGSIRRDVHHQYCCSCLSLHKMFAAAPLPTCGTTSRRIGAFSEPER